MTTTQTTAQRVAKAMGDDGSQFRDEDGRDLGDVAREHGASVERQGTAVRYVFADGSAIVAEVGGWDIAIPGCWCWEGAGHSEECSARRAERA